MTELLGSTPSQTVGPYLAIVLAWADGSNVVAPGTAGLLTITGRLIDGAGDGVPDGLIEIWQADPAGRFNHPDDPRGARAHIGFRGFGRCPTESDGTFVFHTLKPEPLPAGDGGTEAPHLDVSVFARGLLHRLVTRIYFPDEAAANATDPVLGGLEPAQRRLLTAVEQENGGLRFDIRIQGHDETPFFAI
ncbi:protocatechuate 3,4-dioxygenase subunit alpha [Frankia sp. Cas4]|uniref:protocatechuate 3,4-dioxygenase subunit alpha n=1 Tax=Frankia sp. Cas4 TaxID=3073927 RepID=UPI002AD54415|nr:protocatechuate 3,4-dioxygenase subunit alpha [Frankia sp. Cas4]